MVIVKNLKYPDKATKHLIAQRLCNRENDRSRPSVGLAFWRGVKIFKNLKWKGRKWSSSKFL